MPNSITTHQVMTLPQKHACSFQTSIFKSSYRQDNKKKGAGDLCSPHYIVNINKQHSTFRKKQRYRSHLSIKIMVITRNTFIYQQMWWYILWRLLWRFSITCIINNKEKINISVDIQWRKGRKPAYRRYQDVVVCCIHFALIILPCTLRLGTNADLSNGVIGQNLSPGV